MIIVDSSFLVALHSLSDASHDQAIETIKKIDPTSVIVLPAVRPPVQTEVFRMRCHRGAGAAILRVLRRQFEGTS